MALYYRKSDPTDIRELSEQMIEWISSDNPKALEWTIMPSKPTENSKWQNGQWIEPTELELSVLKRQKEREELFQQWNNLPSFIRGPYRSEFESVNRLLDQNDDEAASSMINFTEPKSLFNENERSTFESTKLIFQSAIENLTKI